MSTATQDAQLQVDALVDAARATEPHPAARASLLDAMVRLEEAQESIRVAAAFIAGTPTMIDPATIPTE